MTDVSREIVQAVSHGDRTKWVRPQIQRFNAGGAEGQAAVTFDGGGFS